MSNAMMTNKLIIFRGDILPHLTRQAATLTELATKMNADVARLTAKAAAVTKIINEQGDRLTNVKTYEDVVTLMCMIRMVGNYDGANEEGTELALNTIHGYVR